MDGPTVSQSVSQSGLFLIPPLRIWAMRDVSGADGFGTQPQRKAVARDDVRCLTGDDLAAFRDPSLGAAA